MTQTRNQKIDKLVRKLWYALDCPPSLTEELDSYLDRPVADDTLTAIDPAPQLTVRGKVW
jgi:hypothetical protein